MKKTLKIILLVIFLSKIIRCIDDKKNNLNVTKMEIKQEDNKDNNNEKVDIIEDEPNDKEKEDEKVEEEEEEERSGFYISEKVFKEKLKVILQEKNLKPKKKITKEQLRTIFGLIYKKENKNGDENGGVDLETGLTPEQQNKQYMDSIFNQVTRSLDYDDKIRVKEIKDWIPPIKVQEAYAELLKGLAETMGYL